MKTTVDIVFDALRECKIPFKIALSQTGQLVDFSIGIGIDITVRYSKNGYFMYIENVNISNSVGDGYLTPYSIFLVTFYIPKFSDMTWEEIEQLTDNDGLTGLDQGMPQVMAPPWKT